MRFYRSLCALAMLVLTFVPGAAFAAVPVCTDHVETEWHGLVERDSGGAIVCTYQHEHKDDPRVLDSVFGPLPAYLGGTISYPWETFSAAGEENELKHRVYGWQVRDSDVCVSTGDNGYGFEHMRMELHFDGPLGATTRYHSYYVQAQLCNVNDPTYSGSFWKGGWIDSGSLFIDSPDCQPMSYVPTTGDNGSGSVEQRLEGSSADANNDGVMDCPRSTSTWYARSPGEASFFSGTIKEAWGAIDPANPSSLTMYGGDGTILGTANGSNQEAFHIVSLFIDGAAFGSSGGAFNYDGYTNRYGSLVTDGSCAGMSGSASLDCIPLHMENVVGGVEYQFRADQPGSGDMQREYDVADPETGNSLITYPN